MKEVSTVFDVPYSTVQRTIKNELPKDSPSARGRQRKTTTAQDEQLVAEALAKPQRILRELHVNVASNISRRTVKRRLKEHNIAKRVMVQRPFLTAQNMKARLEWAEFHRHWTLEDWKNVIWSDECSVERGSGKRRKWVFRRPGDKWRQDLIDGRKKGKDYRVMIWAAFSGHLRSPAVILQRDPEAPRGGCTSRGYLKLL
jgi:hypothetical protein